MKGYRFYLEYKTPAHKRKGQDTGTVIAINWQNRWPGHECVMVDAIGAVYYQPNSSVASTTASFDYIHDNCKRISEKRAREIHPALFEYLDYNP